MKQFIPFLAVILGGCQAPAIDTPKASPPPVVESIPATLPAAETPNRDQARLIEALINQNEALSRKLAETPAVVKEAVVTVKPEPTPLSQPPSPLSTAKSEELVAVAPDTSGVIDLTAKESAVTKGEPVNPFAVRSANNSREVPLLVSGVVTGNVRCAMINDRMMQEGDVIDSLTVEAIEAEAVFLRLGSQRLKLPVNEKPVRIKLPN